MRRQGTPTILINFDGHEYCIPGESIHGVNHIDHDIKCSTTKDAYRTYGDAYRALRLRNPHTNGNKRVYRCEICGYYHLATNDGHNHRRRYYDRTDSQDYLREAISRVSEHDLELAKKMVSHPSSLKRFLNAQSREELQLKVSA